MSDQGVFQVHRGIFDHPIFAPEPFTEREAWLWMLSAAAWADKRVRVGRAMVELKRGQLAFALRFLATKFQWSEARVRRFLNRLKTDAMVTVSATREATQVTICNYDQYQYGRRIDDAQTDAQTDEPATHERRKEEDLKKIRNKKEEDTREFDAFWLSWPNKVGKPAAQRAFAAAKKRGATLDEILVGVENYIREKPPDRPWLNPATFLNQDRWKDRPAAVGAAKNGQLGEISAASNKLVESLKRGFGGPAPQEHFGGGADATDARLLSYRGGE